VCCAWRLSLGYRRRSGRLRLCNVTAGYDPQLTSCGSFRLDARKLHHLGPLFGVIGDELSEIGGRANKHRAGRAFILGSARAVLISLLFASFKRLSGSDFIGGRLSTSTQPCPDEPADGAQRHHNDDSYELRPD
jgi:hypothetical protein